MFTQITASAGAGKTYTLTQLFLEHLRAAGMITPSGGCALSSPTDQYGLSEILAATFTNKAASEMKDRVILALKEKALAEEPGREDSASQNIGKDRTNNHAPQQPNSHAKDNTILPFSGTPPDETTCDTLDTGSESPLVQHQRATPAQYERWLMAIFKQASLLNIRTIDSLLFLLVRLSALELGLPPEIAPSFDSEEYYTPLYDAFMTDIAAYNNGIAFQDDADNAVAYDIFSQALEEYYKSLVTYAHHDGFSLKNRLHNDVLRLVQRLLTNADVPNITSQALHTTINALHANLLSSCDTMLLYIEKEELIVHKDLEKSIVKAQSSSAYEKLTNNKITQPGAREPESIVTKKSLHTPSVKAQKAYEQLCIDYELFTSKIPILLGALPLVPLIPLAQELYKRILQATHQTKTLPAEVIPGLANHILTGEYGVSDTLCRMGNRLYHILLDEFQDTSIEQWHAIEPLVVESLSKGGSFTYVGDVKQAIYSWRKGEIRLFDGILQTARDLQREPTLESLDKNWRSSPAIIQFNNTFFSLLHDPTVAQRTLEAMLPSQTPEALLQETQKRLCTIYGKVEQHLPPEDLRPQYASQGSVHLYGIKAKNAELLNKRIQSRLLHLVPELLERWKLEDITILTRSGEESANVASWLTNENIPVITENSFMLTDNPLISRLISLLAFVDYPYDDLALWEFLTGEECFGRVSGLSRQRLDMWLARKREDSDTSKTPIFQLFQKDFSQLWETWLAPFHNRAGLMTAYDMLHESMRIFRLFENRPTDAPFLHRLLELAHYAETQGISSLAGFLQFWEKARKDEKLPSPAHMPAITIMTMHKAKGLEFPVVILPFQHGGKGLDDSLVVDESLGFPCLTKISKFTTKPYFEKEATNAIECLNLLYVAWTRPKYELHSFITGHGRPAMLGKGLEVLLEEFMGLPFDGYSYEDCVFEEPESSLHEAGDDNYLSEESTYWNNATSPTREVSNDASISSQQPASSIPGGEAAPHKQSAFNSLEDEDTNLTSHAGDTLTQRTDARSMNSLQGSTGDSVAIQEKMSANEALLSKELAAQVPLRAVRTQPVLVNERMEPAHKSPEANTQKTPSEYLMDWLPELKIYRTNLDSLTFSATQRGDLFHHCLEHLHIGHDEATTDKAIANAIALGMQKFPFIFSNAEQLTHEIQTALKWFSSLPQAKDWLEGGLREQSLLNSDNQVYRVDLLVPEENSFHAVDYKTGSMASHKSNLQQVRTYLQLLAQITTKQVHGTLVYLDLQQVVEVSL